MVSLMRFERMTSRLGIVCSILLSYKDNVKEYFWESPDICQALKEEVIFCLF